MHFTAIPLENGGESNIILNSTPNTLSPCENLEAINHQLPRDIS